MTATMMVAEATRTAVRNRPTMGATQVCMCTTIVAPLNVYCLLSRRVPCSLALHTSSIVSKLGNTAVLGHRVCALRTSCHVAVM